VTGFALGADGAPGRVRETARSRWPGGGAPVSGAPGAVASPADWRLAVAPIHAVMPAKSATAAVTAVVLLAANRALTKHSPRQAS